MSRFKKAPYTFTWVISHLDYMCKVFPFNVVVRLDEDLSEDGLSYWIVFGVELVKAMERVTVLFGERTPVMQDPLAHKLKVRFCSQLLPFLTACMSRVSTLRSKAVKFMLSNTSLRVWPRPRSMWTISSGYFFMALLMNRSRCFWFMHEDACMCVSTWSKICQRSFQVLVLHHSMQIYFHSQN